MISVPAPTLASVWLAGAGVEMSDELLDWPPDVFALTNIILERSDAFRFVLSPLVPRGPRSTRRAGVSWLGKRHACGPA